MRGSDGAVARTPLRLVHLCDTASWRGAHRRECPNEACRHLQKGNPRWPAMTCEKCGKKYCYAHSLAHPGVTCRQYLASRAQENKLNNQFIQRHSVKWCVYALRGAD